MSALPGRSMKQILSHGGAVMQAKTKTGIAKQLALATRVAGLQTRINALLMDAEDEVEELSCNGTKCGRVLGDAADLEEVIDEVARVGHVLKKLLPKVKKLAREQARLLKKARGGKLWSPESVKSGPSRAGTASCASSGWMGTW